MASDRGVSEVLSGVQRERRTVQSAVRDLEKLCDEVSVSVVRRELLRCLDLVILADGAGAEDLRSVFLEFSRSSPNSGARQEQAPPAPKRPRRSSSSSVRVCTWRNDEYARAVVKRLLQISGCGERSVRERACSMVSELMRGCLYPEAYLQGQDDLCQALLLKMTERLRDRSASVRALALSSLRRLQNPQDAEDVVTGHFVRLMAVDPAKEVRALAARDVATTASSVGGLVERVRDVAPEVRDAALKRLRALGFGQLSREQRVALVRELAATDGRDRAASGVREELLTMICETWLPEASFDLVQIVDGIGPEDHESECQTLVHAVLDRVPTKMSCRVSFKDGAEKAGTILAVLTNCQMLNGAQYEMPADCLIPELALCWALYAEHFFTRVADTLEDVLPELSLLSLLLRIHAGRPFVCRQVLRLVTVSDLLDEAGRVSLDASLRAVIPLVAQGKDVLALAMDNLRRIHPSEDEWVHLISELVSDIRDPLDEIAQSQTSRQEQELQRQDEGFEKVWLSCLEVVSHFLEAAQVGRSRRMGRAGRGVPKDPLVAGLLESVVLPTVTHRSPVVRERAVVALGLFCTLSSNESMLYLFLFLKVLENDVPAVKLTSLKVIIDVLLSHGTTALGVKDLLTEDMMTKRIWGDEDAQERVLLTIVTCLEDTQLQYVTAEGLARLFFVGTLRCPMVLARLAVFFVALPDTSEDDEVKRLRKCMETFWPTYVFSRRSHGRHQKLIEDCYLTALQWGESTNIARKTAVVDLVSLSGFLTRLAGPVLSSFALPSVKQQHDPGCTVRMALALAGHLIRHPARASDFLGAFQLFSFERRCESALLQQLVESLNGVRKLPTLSKEGKEEISRVLAALDSLLTACGTPAQESPAPQSPAPAVTEVTMKRPVVVFAGFKATTSDSYAHLAEIVESLGGIVRKDGDDIDATVTHVCRPPGTLSSKTLAAALFGAWVVSPSWISESGDTGEFVAETKHGAKWDCQQHPLREKKVVVCQSYREDGRFDEILHHSIVETAGGATLCSADNFEGAAIILIGRGQSPPNVPLPPTARVMTRQEFFKSLDPTH